MKSMRTSVLSKIALSTLVASAALSVQYFTSVVHAHHSTAMFDQTKQLVLDGTVKEFRFTNPHSWIYVVVKNEKGEEVVWEIEGASVSQMARQGWSYKSLVPGDKVKIKLSPRVDGSAGGAFQGVEKADGTVLGSSPRI